MWNFGFYFSIFGIIFCTEPDIFQCVSPKVFPTKFKKEVLNFVQKKLKLILMKKKITLFCKLKWNRWIKPNRRVNRRERTKEGRLSPSLTLRSILELIFCGHKSIIKFFDFMKVWLLVFGHIFFAFWFRGLLLYNLKIKHRALTNQHLLFVGFGLYD